MKSKYSGPRFQSLPLAPEIYEAETLQNEGLREVLSAWQAIRNGRTFPKEPRDILRHAKSLIKYFHLSEILSEGDDFRFKILGEAVFPGLDDNLVGTLISQHPDPGVALRFQILMRETVTRREPIRGISRRVTSNRASDLLIESLWLPFGSGEVVAEILSLSAKKPLHEADS